MLRSKYLVLHVFIVALYFVACKQTKPELVYPPTVHIDTVDYKQIEKKFSHVSLYKSPNYLGGLTPNYPIVDVSQLLYDHQGKQISADTDWITGGFLPQANKNIVKINNDYVLLGTRKELQKTYAPISSTQEALAYAVLYTKSFAAFKEFFEKTQFKYVKDKPDVSYSIEKDGYYLVHLFSYKTFGCDHPYYSEIMRVNKDGSVKLLSKVRSFTDPAEDGLCVD